MILQQAPETFVKKPAEKLMKLLTLPLLFLAAIHVAMATDPVPPTKVPVLPFENLADPALPAGQIDTYVFSKLTQLGIHPANLCSDAVFVRRVFLDVIGTLPTADEAASFINDTHPNKRAALIDNLLERPEFADYWGMKWADILRIKAEFPVNLWPNAAQGYDHWVRQSIRENIPYSQFARQLLTANGSNFDAPQVNFYRSAGSKDPKVIAHAVAQTFMGERTAAWPREKLDGFAAFFSQIGFKATGQWKEEIVYYNGFDDTKAAVGKAILPDGTPVTLAPGQDPREVFTDWLISSKNSPFAANAVNRIWYWLVGRGIIQEPDDIRPDNPPSNPDLLAWLSHEFVSTNYDVKHIYRLILNSRTYQLSSIPASTDPKAEAAFATHPLRRVEAEVMIDALDQITGATEDYSSMVPEPFTWMPVDQRATCLPDGSITSSFLDMFGKPPRDTGLLSERAEHPTSGQRLHLLNSSHIQSKLTKSDKLRVLFRSNPTPSDTARQLYLTILSRYPSNEELLALHDYSQTSEAKGVQVWYDLAWALLNSAEFSYRH
jgi:hypothetical protein